MGFSLDSRSIADARLAGISGAPMAGGFMLRISVEFNVSSWDQGQPPSVFVRPARAYLNEAGGLLLGFAHPEVPRPFSVTNFSHSGGVQFDLPLSPGAMEEIERHRNGRGVTLKLQMQAEVHRAGQVSVAHDDVQGIFNVSQWLEALEQAGYGRSLLFEVPLPDALTGLPIVKEQLESARRHLWLGHYGEVVAACRVALESLTTALGQDAALKTARDLYKNNRQQMSVDQRELFMRQAVMEFTHAAHHPTSATMSSLFDRNSAQLTLATTAAIVSAALARHAAASLPP